MTYYDKKKSYILRYQEKIRERLRKYKKLGDLYESGKINEKEAMKIFTNIDEWQPTLPTTK